MFYGYTPLIWAARDGKEELVRELLMRGARVEDKTSGGYTALHKACVKGHKQVGQCMGKHDKKAQL
jgi:ankyrin repeat protein